MSKKVDFSKGKLSNMGRLTLFMMSVILLLLLIVLILTGVTQSQNDMKSLTPLFPTLVSLGDERYGKLIK